MIANYFIVVHFKCLFLHFPSLFKHFQVYYHWYILKAIQTYMTLKGTYFKPLDISLFSALTQWAAVFLFLP